MKKLVLSLTLLAAFAMLSCKKETPKIDPNILIEIDGAKLNGTPALPQDGTMTFKVLVSNSKNYTIAWSVDGKEVSTEKEFTYIATELGERTISFVLQGSNVNQVTQSISITVYGKYKYGTIVLNEGNMTSENGFVTFISPKGEVTDSAYFKVNNSSLGNTTQDLYITNNKMYVIAQNGNRSGGDGVLVVANAETLKKEAAFNNELSTLKWPTHIAVVGNNAYIRDNNGINLFNLSTKNLKLLENAKGATKNRMAVVGDKVFVPAARNVFVITGENVDTIKFTGTVSGVIKSSDNNIWVACTSTPAKIFKINSANNTIIASNEIGDAQIGAGWGASPAISSKGDTIYFSNASTKIYRHIFTQNKTDYMTDVKEHITNANMVYSSLAVHPKTGHVYFNTIKGYGMDYLINNIAVFNFSGATPILQADYKNHTHFPAGTFFTYDFE